MSISVRCVGWQEALELLLTKGSWITSLSVCLIRFAKILPPQLCPGVWGDRTTMTLNYINQLKSIRRGFLAAKCFRIRLKIRCCLSLCCLGGRMYIGRARRCVKSRWLTGLCPQQHHGPRIEKAPWYLRMGLVVAVLPALCLGRYKWQPEALLSA